VSGDDLATTATLVVAVGTVGLAFVTLLLVRATRSSLDLSIRPFLADPRPTSKSDEKEQLLFGAPGRISAEVARGALYWLGGYDENTGEDTAVTNLSVAFENIGAGVAAIVDAEIDPPVSGDVYTSRRFVPVVGIVRVNASIQALPESKYKGHFWVRMPEGVSVAIRYTDANGRQPLVSKATIKQYATKGPLVEQVAVYCEGESEPIVVGRGSY
jgi:hypothetical protein